MSDTPRTDKQLNEDGFDDISGMTYLARQLERELNELRAIIGDDSLLQRYRKEQDRAAKALVAVDELRAENERLRKDAERYRFVRRYPTHFGTEIWGEYGAGLPLRTIYVITPEKLDEAVDRAMSAAPLLSRPRREKRAKTSTSRGT